MFGIPFLQERADLLHHSLVYTLGLHVNPLLIGGHLPRSVLGVLDVEVPEFLDIDLEHEVHHLYTHWELVERDRALGC